MPRVYLMNKKWTSQTKENLTFIRNENGAFLGLANDSGIGIVEADGFAFKNLSRSGKLEAYEDWRLDARTRAQDLAARLSIEEIAGLMLYSPHQLVPNPVADPNAYFRATYKGRPFAESGALPFDLTDQQIKFMREDHVRHILVMVLASPEIAARWNNKIQALAESIGWGIPANNSSDPRHGTSGDAEFNGGAGGEISHWPDGIGLAATFDPALVKRFGEIAAAEYRALGIGTALSPQIDLATDPRWMRFNGTFGEHTQLATDLAKAYCDGFQTSTGEAEIKDGWGFRSVNTMVKHWPGGGSGEAGRDAHYAFGKYAVYPGDNFDEHLKPFTEGAFKLNGSTGQASAVMPYYTISWNQDIKNGENVGNSYNEYIIKDLLREKYGYDGVVCTDWGITGNHGNSIEEFASRCWGVESLSVVERHLKIILAGVDQFGGNSEAQPIIEAYKLGCDRLGEAFMRARFEQSAVRLLVNIFRLGLFENPYLDVDDSVAKVGNPDFMQAGYEAQLKSITLLKNKNQVLPLKKRTKVYIPQRQVKSYLDFFSQPTAERTFDPVSRTLAEKYFEIVDRPEDAEAAIVFMESPITNSYSPDDVRKGGNGYLPHSLQYRPYTATTARATSIAGGDPLETFTNRSYKDKTNCAANESDLDNVLNLKKIMKDKPVIVSLRLKNPTVVAEFEPFADAIVADFTVQTQAVLDIITGAAAPSGLLPLQMPQDMATVESQFEDVAFDMTCYQDSEGHIYDFGYGLDWQGVIVDERTKRYKKS